MKNKQLLMATIVLIAQSAFGQITINESDMFSIGTRMLMAIETSGAGNFTAGNAGASQVWNFTNLNAEEVDSIKIIDASNFTAGPVLPGDRVMLFGSDTVGAFLTSSPQGLLFEGVSTPTLSIKNDPPKKEMTYPLNYAQSFMGTTGSVTQLYMGLNFNGMQLDSMRIRSTIIFQADVDAWGTLNMPFATYSVLRLNEFQQIFDTIDYYEASLGWMPAEDTYADTLRIFKFISKNEDIPVVTAYDRQDDGIFESIDWVYEPSISSISKNNLSSLEMKLFPNPAENFLEVMVANKDFNEVIVMDILGRPVKRASLNNGQASLDISELERGQYLIKLVSESESVTRKFVKN